MPWLDPTEALAAIDRFLAPVEPETVDARAAAGAVPSPFRTILFTDLESSTALTQRLGDERAQEVLRGHNDVVRQALAEHGGPEVKHPGDGIMARFPAATNALGCAQAIQQAVADLANPDLGVKIGLKAGAPIAEENAFYGTAVQIAARVTDQAAAGEIVRTEPDIPPPSAVLHWIVR